MIQLRNAEPRDADFIARMILTALHIDLEGNAPLTAHIAALVAREDTLYTWRHCLIAADDGEAAGLCLAYDGRDYHERSIRTFRMQGGDGKALVDYIPSLEHNADEAGEGEYYLDSIAVLPEYRGHGIARTMISAQIEAAGRLGLLPTLLVDPDNTAAIRLYASLGFRHTGTVHAFGMDYHKYTR